MKKCNISGHVRSIYRSGRTGCRTCTRERHREYAARSPTYYAQRYQREKQKPGFKQKQQRAALKHKYGIDKLPAGMCQICYLNEAKCVDHDHKTGKFRGFLCYYCNIHLGGLENADFLEKALNYLDSHGAEFVRDGLRSQPSQPIGGDLSTTGHNDPPFSYDPYCYCDRCKGIRATLNKGT